MKILPKVFTKKRILPIALLLIVAASAIAANVSGDESATPAVPPSPEIIKIELGGARQAVVVTTSEWAESTGRMSRFERKGDGAWKQVGATVPVTIGDNGFGLNIRNGNGKTPVGVARLTSAFGAKAIKSKLPFRELQPGDCWINTPDSSLFNRWVNSTKCSEPDVNMLSQRNQGLGVGLVTDYNASQSPDGGSGFFVHRSWVSGRVGGSVTLDDRFVQDLIKWLDPEKSPVIVTGPRTWLLGLDSATAPVADATRWKSLQRGSNGSAVKALQQVLNDNGLDVTIDGIFGAQTEQAVRSYQKRRGLSVDGIVGRKTAAAMGLIDD